MDSLFSGKFKIIFAITLFGLGVFLFWEKEKIDHSISGKGNGKVEKTSQPIPQNNPVADPNQSNQSNQENPSPSLSDENIPLDRAGERITKKPFGIFVAPGNSPVSPERFRGYHTGTDFEIFPDELSQEFLVRAVCPGKISFLGRVNGYGGVIVEECQIGNQSVEALYGHLDLSKNYVNSGKEIGRGDVLAILGADKSSQTDGERKHLHLSLKKGNKIDFRGYVQSRGELSGWMDPAEFLGIGKNL